MGVPTVEPVRERIVQALFEAVLATKTDVEGSFFVRPRAVLRQPVPFGDCKDFPTYCVVDGNSDVSGRPGSDRGDLAILLRSEIWAYARDPENVSRHRNRIIRDLVAAVHTARSRGGLTYDSRITTIVHDGGLLAPSTWIIIEVESTYRAQNSEV